jgi:hypothetical protein
MHISRRDVAALAAIVLLSVSAHLAGAGRRFYDDDPLEREPESMDASKIREWDIPLTFDLAENMFGHPGERRRIRALDANTIDEVPNSSWFTNRIATAPMSVDAVVRGPISGAGPAPGPMTVTRAKPAGVSAGFVVRDSKGETWFVQFDERGHDEAASGASMVANKIFHALGYWQAEYHLADFALETASIGEKAVTETPSGKIRQLDRDDLTKLLARSARRPNGTYRVLASRAIPNVRGRFRYYGTRSDDPNDVIPHEHRRVLRALRVFGAWTNLVDMKAKNTLDALVVENGRSVLRHYLQDVGSTFGTGAHGPRAWDEGYEFLIEGDAMWKRLATFGLYIRPWQTTPYTELDAIGRFEGRAFDPVAWRPRVPTAAFLNARADDNFWAARRVMAFSDDLIRAIVKVAQFSDPRAEKLLADVLIERRDKIAQAYLPAINPVIEPRLEAGNVLTFVNAAVEARVAAPPRGGYRVEWFLFDNEADTSKSLGVTTSVAPRLEPPASLPTAAGSYVRVDVSAIEPPRPEWTLPVQLYFRRLGDGWKLVGLDRTVAAE